MNSIKQPTNIPSRNRTRSFGTNITNYSTQQLQQLKNSKASKLKFSLSTQWVKSFPEVSPYLDDIKNYTESQEHQSYILDDFMTWHSDINIAMREQLVGWIIQIQSQLKINQHTLFLAIILIDKYCYHRYISKNRYHLLGISALFLAAKYEEVKIPRLKHFSSICAGKYSEDQILSMQSEILIALNFKILGVTICKHLQENCQFAGHKNINKELCHYILDLCLVQYSFCLIKPMLLSWGIILCAMKMQKCPTICLGDIIRTFNLMQDQIAKTINLVEKLFACREQTKFKSINQKYRLTKPILLIIGS